MPIMQSPICCQERLLKELYICGHFLIDATLNAMLMSKAFHLDLSAIDCLEDESPLNESGSQEKNNLEQQPEELPLNESGSQENNNLEEETHET